MKSRFIDYVLAVPVLILAAPIFLCICVWIKLDSQGPVFFKQTRVGKDGKLFEILKFRTMYCDAPKDTPTHLLKNPDTYITRAGHFLRKTSLDELPQLINIVRGDMSIVGPRPALWNQTDLIQMREIYGANHVLPGLTGWAQVHGRDEISLQRRAELDGYYVAHQGIWMDLRCIFLTIRAVIMHEGVAEGGAGDERESYTGNPLVSVVMATYHRQESLERALHSIGVQSYTNLEVILVDDNADQEWNQKVSEIAEKWKDKTCIPLKYIQNQENQGSAETRNIGIREAEGEYVTFLDDDDIYLPKKVEHQLRWMQRRAADYSITDLELYNEKGKLEEKRTREYLLKENLSDSSRLLACHLMYHMSGTDTLMFRREYLNQIGAFPSIDMGDEFYLMKEAILGEGELTYVPMCDVRALVHTDTEGMSVKERKIAGENALYTYKKTLFSSLKPRERRQVRMRHHLVLAYAQFRDRKYPAFIKETLNAMIAAPFSCIKNLSGYVLRK